MDNLPQTPGISDASPSLDVDMVRLVVVGLAVALFSVASFNAEALWLPSVLALRATLVEGFGLSRFDALVAVLVGSSVFSLVSASAMVTASLRKQHPVLMAGVYLGYLVSCGIALIGVRVLSGELPSRFDALLFGAPAGTSLFVAAVAAIYFSGIHELDDDLLIDDDFVDSSDNVDSTSSRFN